MTPVRIHIKSIMTINKSKIIQCTVFIEDIMSFVKLNLEEQSIVADYKNVVVLFENEDVKQYSKWYINWFDWFNIIANRDFLSCNDVYFEELLKCLQAMNECTLNFTYASSSLSQEYDNDPIMQSHLTLYYQLIYDLKCAKRTIYATQIDYWQRVFAIAIKMIESLNKLFNDINKQVLSIPWSINTAQWLNHAKKSIHLCDSLERQDDSNIQRQNLIQLRQYACNEQSKCGTYEFAHQLTEYSCMLGIEYSKQILSDFIQNDHDYTKRKALFVQASIKKYTIALEIQKKEFCIQLCVLNEKLMNAKERIHEKFCTITHQLIECKSNISHMIQLLIKSHGSLYDEKIKQLLICMRHEEEQENEEYVLMNYNWEHLINV